MNEAQRSWIMARAADAELAEHVFPEMAACEAALESGYGESKLALDGNNLFGTKQHSHPTFGTLTLPTKEWDGKEFIPTSADWVKYPSTKDCFYDRMHTLMRLAPHYENYAKALMAPTPQVYIVHVSKTWSTDPERAEKIQQIFNQVFGESSAGIDLTDEN